MFLQSFQIAGLAVGEILVLALAGFILVKIGILKPESISFLSRLVVEVTLPFLIFCQLIKGFTFSLYPNWWIFHLLSLGVTCFGFLLGYLLSVFVKGAQHKAQFLSLIGFQNAAYLPLVLIAVFLPKEKADVMFIYLFLFLLGFNLIIWSLGVYMLTFTKAKKFQWQSLFSPPVIATLFGLAFVFLGLPKIVPDFVYKPMKMIGDCTVPLAMFVLSAGIAQIRLHHVDKKAISLMVLAKLILMPVIGMYAVTALKVPNLIALLIVMQFALPPATSLSVIMTHYKKEDLLISQGVFFGHIASVITIPIFLSLYTIKYGF